MSLRSLGLALCRASASSFWQPAMALFSKHFSAFFKALFQTLFKPLIAASAIVFAKDFGEWFLSGSHMFLHRFELSFAQRSAYHINVKAEFRRVEGCFFDAREGGFDALNALFAGPVNHG